MITIPYEARKFPTRLHGKLHGHRSLRTSWPELAWAAITVGRRDWPDVFEYGVHSVYECVYRLLTIKANVRENSSGGLAKTHAFQNLDRSEKAAASYFIGMALAKLFAAKMLGVPYVMHLDRYAHLQQPLEFRSNKRPDLFGFDQHRRLLVLEAKGRTQQPSSADMEKAKRQTQSLKSIGGVTPRMRVAAITHFRHGFLQLQIEDPREDSSLFEFDPSLDDILRDYYRGFVELVTGARSVDTVEVTGREIRVVELPVLNVRIGVDEAIVVAFSENDGFYQRVVSLLPTLRQQPLSSNYTDEFRSEGELDAEDEESDGANTQSSFFYGSDGICVWLGDQWSTERMHEEPRYW